MLTQHGERVLSLLPDDRLLVVTDEIVPVRADDGGPRRPDLDDPATLGCILHLVREAWSGEGTTQYARLLPRGDWCVTCTRIPTTEDGAYFRQLAYGPTEAAALVAALEAAPTGPSTP
jgi:hypothetical protein